MSRALVTSILCLFLTACSASLVATNFQTEAPGYARVVVDHVDGSTVWLLVYNEAAEPLTIDRDAMWLGIGDKHFVRDPGTFGSRRFHVVPPGGVHDVKLDFDLPHGGGKPATLHLERGIIARGAPLPVPPIAFRTR